MNKSRDIVNTVVLYHMSRNHKGRSNGINAETLSHKIGIAERTLRHVISDLRTQGVPVVGTPDTGYFIAQTAAELDECCQFLRSRALHSLGIEARLRKIPLPTLLGQLNLKT